MSFDLFQGAVILQLVALGAVVYLYYVEFVRGKK